jgi:flavorubredoxin
VGAVDWGVRDFHGYLTGRGTTYNAYLVMANKVALIDTVRAPFTPELLHRIGSVTDLEKIDYLVCNHAEMDHSGALPAVVAAVKPERVFASARGVEALGRHFHAGPEITGVKDGDSLSLGDATLTFVETPMLHWPDNMVTYLADEQVLFSNDAFGMHLATSERFADEIEEAVLNAEAARYFANILMPLAPVVSKGLEKVGKLGLRIDVLAPSHGPIRRRAHDIGEILRLYSIWAAGQRRRTAAVVYDTMWHSTDMMAQAVGDGLAAGGVSVKVMPLKSCHRSDVAAEILEAGALAVGTAELNNGMLPTVADVLSYLKGLKPRGLIGAAFGSYGWSGGAVGQVEAALREMKVELVGESVRVKYVPDAQDLARCAALGGLVAEKLKEPAAG